MVEPTMPDNTAGSAPCARRQSALSASKISAMLAARLGRARTFAHIERLAFGITEREPQIARAPVTGDERGQSLDTRLMACTCRR